MQNNFQSKFLREIAPRGFVHSMTDAVGLDAVLAANEREGCGPGFKAYIGFDATADSLHAGSLVSLMLLHHLGRAGHDPYVLLGGATTRIGDPEGKDATRPAMKPEDVRHNIFELRILVKKLMPDAVVVNNADWYAGRNVIDFMSDVGRHFSVNELIKRDTAARRLESGKNLSYLEFFYAVAQAYDFAYLAENFGVMLQMGGSDQYGNLVAGIDLARKMNQNNKLFGLTSPLLTTSSGAKMGKTSAGAVWLSAAKTSVFDFWQFWRNTADADVNRFLKLFTFLDVKEIDAMTADMGDVAAINDAKVALADKVTQFVHGKDAVQGLQAAATGQSDAGLPVIALEAGTGILTALVSAGFCASNSEARRLIQAGGARLNDVKVSDEKAVLAESGKLSAGRKKHVKIEISCH